MGIVQLKKSQAFRLAFRNWASHRWRHQPHNVALCSNTLSSYEQWRHGSVFQLEQLEAEIWRHRLMTSPAWAVAFVRARWRHGAQRLKLELTSRAGVTIQSHQSRVIAEARTCCVHSELWRHAAMSAHLWHENMTLQVLKSGYQFKFLMLSTE